jgi:two-component system cell cycle sensor histidine kinase/response regulator CckA
MFIKNVAFHVLKGLSALTSVPSASQDNEKPAFDLGSEPYLPKPCPDANILNPLRISIERIRDGISRRREPREELDPLNTNGCNRPMASWQKNKNFENTEKSKLAELALDVGEALTRRHALREILQACSGSMLKHLDGALARIWTFDEKSIALELQGNSGTDPLLEDFPFGQGIVERIAQERRPYRTNRVLDELDASEKEWARREGTVAFAGYPLIVENRLVGVMGVFTRNKLADSTVTALSAIADSLALGIKGKQAERILHESEERFRQLAENINEVFWLTDPTRKEFLYVSPAYESIWGRTCKSLFERPDSFFDAIHPDDRSRVLDTFRAANGVSYELEYRIVRPDGAVRWIRDRAFPVCDSAGGTMRIAGVAEEVTEKRQLEMQLRQSQKMQAIGRLAGGVVHDFNNLLSVIFGHSALLATASPSQERLRDSLAEINRAAERAAGLTRQLLTFSRQQVVESRILNLETVLAESQNLLRRLIGEDIRLKMLFLPCLSRVRVDAGQIGQVLMNLALNARDAMPKGGQLTIETSEMDFDSIFADAQPEMRPGRYVMLSVSDTGCGMTPEVQARVFEAFFSTKNDSTGLGLSVVEGIVKQSGGYVTVTSQPGKGTTFRIYFPAVAGAIEKSPQKPPSNPVRGSETILLVEDEDPVREVTALLLESLGYQVLHVCSAEEALDLVEANTAKIDLLLTDVVMTGMGGRELAEALCTRSPGLKVLFQSGYTDDMVLRYGILHSEVAFLQKPFTIDTLAKRIREILDRR